MQCCCVSRLSISPAMLSHSLNIHICDHGSSVSRIACVALLLVIINFMSMARIIVPGQISEVRGIVGLLIIIVTRTLRYRSSYTALAPVLEKLVDLQEDRIVRTIDISCLKCNFFCLNWPPYSNHVALEFALLLL